nr:permease [Anaerolineae bacterium]
MIPIHQSGRIRVLAAIRESIITFTTVFLGIFVEAVPFLLLGSVASGLVEVFVSQDSFKQFMPRSQFLAAFVGGLLGLTFPVCECGVVPLTRRLFNKGLPISAGLSFLLAAPIINPVVMASTYAAFGWGPILIGRFLLGFAIAVSIGIVFSFHNNPSQILRQASIRQTEDAATSCDHIHHNKLPLPSRLRHAMSHAGEEFFEMAPYLIIGSLLASLMQTVFPRSALLSAGSGPVLSVAIMHLLAYVLAICSTVDAFLALAFINTFTTGSVLGFLVFGPMIDIKSTLMFLGVFKQKYVIYLFLLTLLLSMVSSLFINLVGGG